MQITGTVWKLEVHKHAFFYDESPVDIFWFRTHVEMNDWTHRPEFLAKYKFPITFEYELPEGEMPRGAEFTVKIDLGT